MNFLHQREHLKAGEVVVLQCDTQCNFMLIDDSNFGSYQRGGRFAYYGGHFKYFPAKVVVPNSGYWNIVIDLGGGSANIRYSIGFLKHNHF